MSTTKTAQHTPGPWIAHNWRVVSEIDGYAVCDVEPRRVGSITDANARLIAAAPDLLAACKGLLEDYQDQFGPTVCDCRPEPENQGHVCNACKARDGIARAEGK